MKKLIYISFIFAFILAFASCQKEIITPENFGNDPDSELIDGRDTNTDPGFTRGGEGDDGKDDDPITDPDEDEDFDEDDDDGITDPDEDEDFEEEDNGK